MRLSILHIIVLASLPFAANAELSAEQYVTDRLVSARVADKIRKNCEDIDARMFRALGRAHALKDWALQQGYSEDEVRAFMDDRAEKDRIYSLADGYLARRGLEEKGWCAVGFAEIEANTIAGSLLR